MRDGLHADELDRRDVGPVLGDAGRDLGGPRERLDRQDDPEDVADHEDGADGHEDHGQVHLPVVVARLHVEAGLHDAPVDETEMLSTPYSLSKKVVVVYENDVYKFFFVTESTGGVVCV